MWILYQIIYGSLLLLAGPVLLLRRGRHYLESLPARLGLRRSTPAPRAPLWIHAVSVGEVGVAATLLDRLGAETPLLVTTVTPTGQAEAHRRFADRATVDYLPFELGWVIRSFLGHHRPTALLLSEGDYWPLLLEHVRRRELPVGVVNARIGDRSFRRLERFARWLGPLLGSIDVFAVQTAEDRRRLLALGVPSERVVVTGNLKFEAPEPRPLPELEREIRRVAAGRPVLVAGSTMAGEEELVLEAFDRAGGGTRALLVVAPRHPERWQEVADRIASRFGAAPRRSAGDAAPGAEVFLLDSMGELASIYRVASAAFIGGTLVPTGGHNPLEPARFAVPTAVGPSMENFRAMAEAFDRRDAWRRVDGAEALGKTWREWLDAPEAATRVGRAAAELVEQSRGALDRTISAVEPVLARGAEHRTGEPQRGPGRSSRVPSSVGEAGSEGPRRDANGVGEPGMGRSDAGGAE